MFIHRAHEWWSYVVLQTERSMIGSRTLRWKKETFLYLCSQLHSVLQRKDTVMRKAISVEKRVANTLWCLATPSEYRTIAHLFGVTWSTVCIIVHTTVNAIVSVLLDKYIVFHKGHLSTVVEGFETKWNFPQCGGAIDGCHIPVQAPLLNHTTAKAGIPS